MTRPAHPDIAALLITTQFLKPAKPVAILPKTNAFQVLLAKTMDLLMNSYSVTPAISAISTHKPSAMPVSTPTSTRYQVPS